MNIDGQERIDRYLLGEMSAQEGAQLESDLKQDPDLHAMYLHTKELIQCLDAHDFQQKLEWVKTLDKAEEDGGESTSIVKRLKHPFVLAIAACTVGLLIWMIGIKDESYYDGELFEPYPDLVTTRSSSVTDLQKAMYQYNLGNYREASKLFQNILSQGANEEAQFYLGVSLVAQKKFDQAIDVLSEVPEGFYPKDYYLGIAYQEIGQQSKSQELFNRCNNCTNKQIQKLK